MKRIALLIGIAGILMMSSCARKAPCPAYTDAGTIEQPLHVQRA